MKNHPHRSVHQLFTRQVRANEISLRRRQAKSKVSFAKNKSEEEGTKGGRYIGSLFEEEKKTKKKKKKKKEKASEPRAGTARVIPFTRDKSREEFREGGSSRGRAYSITVERHSNSILRRFAGRGRKPRNVVAARHSLAVRRRGSPPSYSPGPFDVTCANLRVECR